MASLFAWIEQNPKKAGLLTLTACGAVTCIWFYMDKNRNKSSKKNREPNLIFVTGRSGAGKTSLGENFKSLDNFIHFDGEQYSYGADPIKDSGKVVTTDTYSNRSQELVEAYTNAENNGYEALYRDKKVELSVWEPYYSLLAKEIKKVQLIHRNKNIVITQAVYPYMVRQYLRNVLGKQLIFIIINTPKELLVKRVTDRMTKEAAEIGQTLEERISSFGATMEQFKGQLSICMKGFQLKQDNEPNTYQIDVNKNMTQIDVFRIAQQLIKSHQTSQEIIYKQNNNTYKNLFDRIVRYHHLGNGNEDTIFQMMTDAQLKKTNKKNEKNQI